MSLRSRNRRTARARRHALAGLPRRVAALEHVVAIMAPIVTSLVEHARSSADVTEHLIARAEAAELTSHDLH